MIAAVTNGAVAGPFATGPPEVGRVMTEVALQLAVILIAARLGGFIAQRYFRAPSVLGELAAGMLFGPYALGGLPLPGWGPVFPLKGGPLPVSTELYGFAMLASIVLLFISGLETDPKTFLRYSVSGLAVGVGGIVTAFAIGDVAAVLLGIADSFLSPPALFLGTVATATSVGLTARLLSERRKMGSPEGVTILAAAVFDDVLGIVVLALVVAVTRAKGSQSTPADWKHIALIGTKALGFWILFTAVGLLLARRLTHLLKRLRSMTTIASICVGLALLVAGLSEMAGLAMIIGAYIVGLSLSQTDIAYELQERLRPLYDFLIPIFFCVMGMLVNFFAVKSVLLAAVFYGLAGIGAKIVGCGIPAWFTGFNLRGAVRIGTGMIPRAEVALIVAGIGLSSNIISPEVFGIAVSLTMLSTLLAPPLIVRAFQGGSGLRVAVEKRKEEEIRSVSLDLPSAELAEFLVSRINRAFRNEEYFVHRLHTDTPTWQIRKEDISFTIIQDDRRVILNMPARYQHIARFIVLEEILNLSEFLESVRKMQSPEDMGAQLLKGVFE